MEKNVSMLDESIRMQFTKLYMIIIYHKKRQYEGLDEYTSLK